MHTTVRSAAIFSLAIFYLSNLFIKSPWLGDLNSVILLVVLVLSLFTIRGTSLIISTFLFVAGSALLFLYGAPLEVWTQGINRNLYLVVMFTLVPLFGIPIRRGDYISPLKGIFNRYIYRDSQFYILVKTLVFFIATMINVAAIQLIHQISQASIKSENKQLIGTALSRGYSATIIWAPSYASVALVMELTGTKWLVLFPYGLSLGILSLLLGWFMVRFRKEDSITGMEKFQEIAARGSDWRKILELVFFIAVLIVSIAAVSAWSGLNTVTVVALASLILPVIWIMFLRKAPAYFQEFKEKYFKENLTRLKDEIALFIGAGFLATAVSFSHLGDVVPGLLEVLTAGNPLLFSIVVISVIVLLALVGVHPIITVTILGSTVRAAAYGVSSTFLALVLISGWSFGTVVSPSAAVVIVTAGMVERSIIEVGMRWNLKYVTILMTVTIIVLNIFRTWGLI